MLARIHERKMLFKSTRFKDEQFLETNKVFFEKIGSQ